MKHPAALPAQKDGSSLCGDKKTGEGTLLIFRLCLSGGKNRSDRGGASHIWRMENFIHEEPEPPLPTNFFQK
jgi:hypothetical protein